MKRRCWFCRYRKEQVAKVLWDGKWRKACPTYQIRFARGTLREHR